MPSGSRSLGGNGTWRQPVGDVLRLSGTILFAVVVAVAPLLAGTVHRPSMTAVLGAVALMLTATAIGERLRGSRLRGTRATVLPAVLALLPALQCIPFPTAWRGLFDREGLSLLANAPGGLPRFWPLSFDPLATRQEIGAAVATWMVFLLGLHVASGRRTRLLVLRLLALAGLVAAVSGIAHRLFDVERLYGLFSVEQVLPGPFINPNHAAEFYELTAFCALAMAAAAEREVRLAWGLVAMVEVAAALTTLSRGALLALLAGGGVLMFLLVLRAHRASSGESEPQGGHRSRTTPTQIVAMALFALILCGAAAIALGAAPVWDEVANTNLNNHAEKIYLWRDALDLVARHPAGIGRQAFEQVYPATKSLPVPVRFQFVENLPLQALIDVGWPGLLLIAVGVWALLRRVSWRRDAVEAALVGGLAAVLVHNLVDFGLETLGLRLPFAAVAGVLLGRSYGRGESRGDSAERRSRFPRLWEEALVGVTLVGVGLGLSATWSETAEEAWARWQSLSDHSARLALALDSGRRYPTSYTFPLLQSFDEPLREEGAPRSPRLSALNRALRLCPSCGFISRASGEALFALGRPGQALAAFRDVVRYQPAELASVLEEVTAAGFSSADIATLALGRGEDAVYVARFLIARKGGAEVAGLLEQARVQGSHPVDLLLLKGELSLAQHDAEGAREAFLKAKAAAPRDGRAYAALAQIENQAGHTAAALDDARAAVNMNPLVVDFARLQVSLVFQLKRWDEIERALDQLKTALRQSGGNVAEVHLMAGQAFELQGNSGRAALEFRNAILVDPRNLGGWQALARLAEARGDLDGATRALQKVLVLSPADHDATESLKRLAGEQRDAQLRQLLPASTVPH